MLEVQRLPVLLPAGEMLIQQRGKAGAMLALQQMGQFVDDDVLQALHWLLGQLQVEPDPTGDRVATAPLGLDAVRFAAILVADQAVASRRLSLNLAPILTFTGL